MSWDDMLCVFKLVTQLLDVESQNSIHFEKCSQFRPGWIRRFYYLPHNCKCLCSVKIVIECRKKPFLKLLKCPYGDSSLTLRWFFPSTNINNQLLICIL